MTHDVAPRSTQVEVLATIFWDVEDELTSALSKFEAFNSPHEGWAVIREELDELWEHVKANTGRTADARDEAFQVAAMALRYVHDLCDGDST